MKRTHIYEKNVKIATSYLYYTIALLLRVGKCVICVNSQGISKINDSVFEVLLKYVLCSREAMGSFVFDGWSQKMRCSVINHRNELDRIHANCVYTDILSPAHVLLQRCLLFARTRA